MSLNQFANLRWMLLATLLLELNLASLVTAYKDGAPHHRCSNLVPFHGVNPQVTRPPYGLVVSTNRYSPGDTIQVTLRGVDGARFVGFALTAHRLTGDTEDLVGGFQETANAQGSFWYSGANATLPNCLTHKINNDFSELTFNWTAPSKSVGDVSFTTPVVQSFRVFWANVTSAVVVANVPSDDTTFPVLNIGRSPSPIVGSCGTDFGCVRSPALCDLVNCEIYVKFVESEGKLKFELHATGNYITLGLSEDDKMKDDLTFTCTAGNEYSMQLGYNTAYRHLNEKHRWIPMTNKYIELVNGNRIRCEFTLPLSVINITAYPAARRGTVPPTVRTFDLRSLYYIFIAYGKTYSDTNTVVKHVELPAISDAKVNLLGRGSYSAHRITPLRRAHGSVMLLAWQVLMPLGANLAMFYRSLFSKSLGGVQLWFYLHRGFVLSAYLLSIVGLLLIFAQFGWAWTSSYSVTVSHGAIGLTMLCLATVQIVMGILRPDKDAPRRPVFKLAHQIVGYTSLGLTDSILITIGFLATLPETYRTSHTVFAFLWLAFHVTFKIILSILMSRWNSRALVATNKLEDQAALEKGKRTTLLWLFVSFVTGMLIIFLAWFITLMLY